MKIHAVGGLPRSGTTLLCNVLAQNPRFAVSSTSCVAMAVRSVSAFVSNSDEMKSELAADKERAEARLSGMLRGMIQGWYADVDAPVVIDKSRAWNGNALLLQQLYPDAKIIIVVRDLRDVFASIEKQHRKNPSLNPLPQGADTLVARASNFFDRNKGMIGAPVCGIEDVLRRKPSNVELVKYEALVANPDTVFKNLYNALGEEWYEHDFDNVEAVSTELDAQWLHKFPHDGSGKIQPPEGSWRDYLSIDVAQEIMQQFAGYNGAFGYV